jgi:alkylation response protein AidB-like acyl-CoA dehydrogenase
VEAETRYHPNAEQLALASTIDESLTALLPLSRLHTSYAEDTQTWSGLEEVGIFGISASEDHGGSGLGAAEEALIVMSLGRRLAAPSVLATIGAAHGSIHGKRVAAAYRHGDRVIVVEDTAAELILVREPAGAALYRASDCTGQALDEYLWLAGLRQVVVSGAPVLRFDESQLLRLRLIDAAALAGMSQSVLEMGVAYAGIRTQFGRPIGTFQAVKHHCANMAIAARCARDQVSFAAVALDEQREDAALQVECALYVAGTSALENAGKNIQIHGGIGFSDEADPHLFLKRAQLQMAIAGGLEATAARMADMKGAA